MSTPHKGSTNGEHDEDPTGMRDVLASLADPAPMPRQLADRICASLEQEHHARLGAMQGQHPAELAHHEAMVHDFAAEKAHRRPQQWILAGAAALAVGALGLVVVDQFVNTSPDSSSVAAQANQETADNDSGEANPQDSNESGSDAGSRANVDDQGEQAQDNDDAAAAPQDDAGAPVDEATGASGLAALGDDVFALGAQTLLSSAAAEINGEDIPNGFSLPEALDVQMGDVSPLDSAEANNCAQAAGESSGDTWLGLNTTVNGEEVVILGDSDEASSPSTQAWALDSSCPSNTSAPVLKGPVQLP